MFKKALKDFTKNEIPKLLVVKRRARQVEVKEPLKIAVQCLGAQLLRSQTEYVLQDLRSDPFFMTTVAIARIEVALKCALAHAPLKSATWREHSTLKDNYKQWGVSGNSSTINVDLPEKMGALSQLNHVSQLNGLDNDLSHLLKQYKYGTLLVLPSEKEVIQKETWSAISEAMQPSQCCVYFPTGQGSGDRGALLTTLANMPHQSTVSMRIQDRTFSLFIGTSRESIKDYFKECWDSMIVPLRGVSALISEWATEKIVIIGDIIAAEIGHGVLMSKSSRLMLIMNCTETSQQQQHNDIAGIAEEVKTQLGTHQRMLQRSIEKLHHFHFKNDDITTLMSPELMQKLWPVQQDQLLDAYNKLFTEHKAECLEFKFPTPTSFKNENGVEGPSFLDHQTSQEGQEKSEVKDKNYEPEEECTDDSSEESDGHDEPPEGFHVSAAASGGTVPTSSVDAVPESAVAW
eukprot:CAMPEP_0117442604 /NCGR_PEP_ID=MMETSP0759-20121206/4242_1 /TAXON_ID=63605 /ORGANISM="Percolomonas cosmopolitus, Strain WS" /LENGTH=459 /DNA_ID=CAMNT_0005234507 /DNA_START=918 /DNA_END=2294 /DNA_ORIENTATION=+